MMFVSMGVPGKARGGDSNATKGDKVTTWDVEM